jgi:hypothetical protein
VSVLSTLQALPVGPVGALPVGALSVASSCRVLAHTPEGRAQVAAFAGRVAGLLGCAHTRWIQKRAEAAEDTANALAYVVHQELPSLGVQPSFEVRQARHTEVNDLWHAPAHCLAT